ncbi:CdaR family transcriptional regulator [Saccharibacillus sp. JS10]|uniref:PucR family transcriptional regulator n=1 Tax=Saccharibacillus sp. JS10 TaxID=2950552 RepID=UPI00210A1795|nr:helix-turn-helix domain-containing protein [Saccharibacillus sp. JS10]MCQ4087744.1 helix-turn-helix domain-containing protein [Saccharibacillus sp. JS10]
MNVQQIRNRLQEIVGHPVELLEVEVAEWKPKSQGDDFSSLSWTDKDSTWFAIPHSEFVDESKRWAFRVEAPQLEDSVQQLIALLVESVSFSTYKESQEEENDVQQLGRWLSDKLEQDDSPQELPDTLLLKSRLFTEKIPFLLMCEGAQNSLGGYEELHQLLSTFLEREVLVVPLHAREWLLLIDRLDVLEVSEEREEESDQELLEAFGLGLYELIASEWTGIFNLSVSEPLQPAYGLVRTLRLLRESVFLGKTFHVTQHVHLPWGLGLERLVYSIPSLQRERFVEEIEGLDVILADNEVLTTLETFFQMNSNVSETAKRLYIHRNTLIYRLDKVKQETGLDVRNFGDAILMKLSLLLDKVTKD